MKNFSKKFHSLAYRTPRWFKKSAREKLSKEVPNSPKEKEFTKKLISEKIK